ncbi:MAG: hypothetical protein ABR499_02665 [Gemmatimonadaceae bacterium]
MNCDDYLSMLATLPVEELAYGRARQHAAGCRDCDRVTRVVAEREHNMLMAFGGLQSSVPAAQTAASALRTSRRQKVALYRKIGLGIATVASVVYLMMSRIMPAPPPSSRVSETFRLQCLSPEQAAEVLRPHIEATGLITFRPNSPLGVIRVEASPQDMVRARSLLERYDTPAQSQCAVQVTVPKVP